LLNFSEVEVHFDIICVENLGKYQPVLGNYEDGELSGKVPVDGRVLLRGFEARIYLLGY
jgi:hypothetical protein